MNYYVDTADFEIVKEAFDLYPVKGVTMNPTIAMADLKGKNIDFFEQTKQIRKFIGKDTVFHIQVIGETTEDMIKDAEKLKEEIGGNLFVKIPACPQGYRAMRQLTNQGFQITATAIIDVNQALLAAASGAKVVAPYVNRISNISGDGDKVLCDIVKALAHSEYDTKVIGASFKSSLQVEKAAIAGAYGVALGYDVLKSCATHVLTETSVTQFTKDWESTFGEGKQMHNL